MDDLAQRLADLSPAKRVLMERLLRAEREAAEPIAVVGMSCRFPGAPDISSFWQLIEDNVDATAEIPASRWDVDALYDPSGESPGKMSTRWGGFLTDVDQFDPLFFGVSPREADKMDPQQRLLLEVVWEALEYGCIPAASLRGTATGVFVGIGGVDYSRIPVQFENYLEHINAHTGTGNALSIAANRISYTLDLRGPSLSVDTACSSSLVAAHLAISSLRSRECNVAVAGGVNLILSPETTLAFSNAHMLSPDGRCRPFDEQANGYVRGEGCGIVVLKRLSDAVQDGNVILAVIRGSAVNQDGRTSGITAPNGLSQQEVIRTALAQAGLSSRDVSYIEAHGTGTPLGDPIEIQALRELFLDEAPQSTPCYVGSVKANIGHTETAAGVAGLIKVMLMMQHRRIPSQTHLNTLNPRLSLSGTRLEILREPVVWESQGRARLAGVSAFGFGGTNAHLILEEPPALACQPPENDRPIHVAALSARSESALCSLAGSLASHLERHATVSLGDVCFAMNAGRTPFPHRAAVTAGSTAQLVDQLGSLARNEQAPAMKRSGTGVQQRPQAAFLFAGQGSQYPGMARQLFETQPVFHDVLVECEEILRDELERPLLQVIHGSDEDAALVNETLYTQPALFAIEYGLAELWKTWGVFPRVLLGHSVGEYAAACVADVFSLEDGLRLVAGRARLMQALPSDGLMAIIFSDHGRIAEAVKGKAAKISIAAVNGPMNTVISGRGTGVREVLHHFEKLGVRTQLLTVSHAFHSPLMEPMLAEFRELASSIDYHPPSIPLAANLTGELITDQVLDEEYWVRQIREPVQFAKSVQRISELEPAAILEIGPSSTLLAMARRCCADAKCGWIASLRKQGDDGRSMLEAVSELFVRGFDIDWRSYDRPWPRRRLALPTYPFERATCWYPPSRHVGWGRTRVARAPAKDVLLGHRLPTVLPQTLFETTLGADEPAYLADHKLQGSTVLPAAAYIEQAVAAAEQVFGAGSHTVDNLSIQQPLVLASDVRRQIQLSVSPESQGSCTFETYSRPADEEGEQATWTLHATGTIRAAGETPAEPPKVELPGDEGTGTTQDRAEFYQQMADRGLRYGPAFQVLDHLGRGSGQAHAELELPKSVAAQLGAYHLHPVVLDGCLQSMAGLVPLESDGSYSPYTYVPTFVRRVSVFSRPTQRMRTQVVSISASETSSPEVVEGDAYLLDDSGQTIARLEGVRLQRLGRPVASTGSRLEDWVYHIQWESQPLASAESTNGKPGPSPRRDWLVLADDSGVAAALAVVLEQRGERCTLVRHGERFDAREGETEWRIDAGSESDYERLLETWAARSNCSAGILHFWSLDIGLPAGPPLDASKANQLGCGSALHLVRQLVRAKPARGTRLHLVTKGAQLLENDSSLGVMQTPLWGLGRTVANEMPELGCQLIDLDPDDEIHCCVERLAAELMAVTDESQVALRGGQRYVPRLQRAPEAIDVGRLGSTGCRPSTAEFRLDLGTRSGFEALQYVSLERRQPAAGQVEVRVRSAGLNFSDVLKAMGLYPGLTDAVVPLGIECAGAVTSVGEGVDCFEVGDEVMGVAPYCFASHALTAEYALVHKPEHLSDDEACTIPITFLTSYYSLVRLARLQPGERVLIHAGAGGVGLAAIQVAQHIGAEVFATAGSDEKREFLRSLGVQHVMSSRTLDFADQIRRITDRKGVDVVLNSLPGDAISASLSALAAYGRFLEVGKTDIYQNRMIGLLPFQDNLSYFAIDLDRMLRQRPDEIQRLFGEIMIHVASGVYRPTPLTRFAAEQTRDAFRYMGQRKNIGKVVISLDGAVGDWDAAEAVPVSTGRDATYLITGGLGALGMRLATWLHARGAEHIALLARRAAEGETAARIAELRETGCDVIVLEADVCNLESLQSALDTISDRAPPLRGIFHAAGVLSDGMLYDMHAEQLEAAMAPKFQGAWNLHEVTRGIPLDFFVLFSSAASVFGSPGQGNYAAGNAFLDGLAQYRARQGLPATSINWGPWAEAGMAVQDEGPRQLSTRGMGLLPPDRAQMALAAILDTLPTNVAVMDARWDQLVRQASGKLPKIFENFSSELAESVSPRGLDKGFRRQHERAAPAERLMLLQEFVASEVARAMGMERSELSADQPLDALGLDSLIGMELKNEIEALLGVDLPIASLMDGPTVASLAGHAAAAMAGDGVDSAASVVDSPAAAEGHGLLALLASGGSAAPLFCLHPVGGDIRSYFQLAQSLAGSRPVYAFRARGLDANREPHHSVTDLARDYLQLMRDVQPEGPYHLCGWSTGGIFAYEMARQLKAAGVQVAAVVLIDTPLPKIFRDVDLDDEARFLFDLVNFSNWFAGTQMEVDYAELKALGTEDSLDAVLRQARRERVLPADASVEYLRRIIRVCREHVRAVMHYQVEPFGQPVFMLRPSDTSALAEASGQSLGQDLGWRDVLGALLTIESVPGDHFSMLTSDNAPILAQAVESRLATADLPQPARKIRSHSAQLEWH